MNRNKTKLDLSLCIINKNDSLNLEKLLIKASDFVNDIVVVDTGSTDNSLDVIKKYTSNYYHSNTEFNDEDGDIKDFSLARNKSFELAKNDWCMYLDTDDELDNWDRLKIDFNELKKLKLENLDKIYCMSFEYLYSWNDDRTKCCQKFYANRIFYKPDGWQWIDPIHEQCRLKDKTKKEIIAGNSNIKIIHLSQGARGILNNRNKKILEAWLLNPDINDEEKSKINYYLGDEYYFRNKINESIKYYNEVESKSYFFEIAKTRSLNATLNLEQTEKVHELFSKLIKEFNFVNKKHLYIINGFAYLNEQNFDMVETMLIASSGKDNVYSMNPYDGYYLLNMFESIIKSKDKKLWNEKYSYLKNLKL